MTMTTVTELNPTPLLLEPIEARILGTLMEKARTVPDSYPLSLNSLLSGCNQKTSRESLMELVEGELLAPLERLKELNLVRETSGSRTARFEHNFQRGVGVPEQSAVLLGLLMLRGPQTAAELRLNSERWYKFADTGSVEAFLDELQERSDAKGGPLALRLPKAPGAREARWVHLLCGPVDATAPVSSGASGSALERIAQLEDEVRTLRATVEKLCAELGMSPPGQE